jgi:hypothetical protein
MSAILDYTVVQEESTAATRAAPSPVQDEVHQMKRHIEGMLWAVSFLSLMVASMTTNRAFLVVIVIVWVLSTGVVIPLHFVRAWRRWPKVPNKGQYAVWVGFETFATVTLIALFVYSVSSH